MSYQPSLNKKIIFSIIAIILFLISAEIAARTYHAVKHRNLSVYAYGFKTFRIAVSDLLLSQRTTDVYDQAVTETTADKAFSNRREHYEEPAITREPYTMVMWGHKAYMNALGFRGHDIADKPADVTRIVMMGGSFVECVGVGDDETWESLLQKRLDEDASRKFEIINAGLGANNMSHILVTLITRVTKLDPDYVVLISNYNNHGLVRSKTELPALWRLSKFLYNMSQFYAMLRGQISVIVYKDSNYFLYNYEMQITPEDVDELRRKYRNRLEQIFLVFEENNIKLILGTQPEHLPYGLVGLRDLSDEKKIFEMGEKLKKNKKLTYYETEYYLQGLLNEEARVFAAKNNLPLFDGVSVFRGDNKRYFIDQIHLNAKGTELFAEALYNFLLRILYPAA